MKKLLNEPDRAVADYLLGLAATTPTVAVDHDRRIVYRAEPAASSKVAVISGGGSGHEPLHSGYVGTGMLDAACVGEIFSSPSPGQITDAITRCASDAGCLLIVKNYMGDQLNFGIAAERATEQGIDVRILTIDDDVATRSTRSNGRRGLGLTVIAEKILGAAAEQGHGLDELLDIGERVRAGRSMGVSLSACTHPQAGFATFDLGVDEIEIGTGIHGEVGTDRRPALAAREIVDLLVGEITQDLAAAPGTRFIAMVNGLGGTPLIELYVIANGLSEILVERGLHIDRYLVGSFITSLEMAGCMITLLPVDAQLLELWDAPVTTSALRWDKGVGA